MEQRNTLYATVHLFTATRTWTHMEIQLFPATHVFVELPNVQRKEQQQHLRDTQWGSAGTLRVENKGAECKSDKVLLTTLSLLKTQLCWYWKNSRPKHLSRATDLLVVGRITEPQAALSLLMFLVFPAWWWDQGVSHRCHFGSVLSDAQTNSYKLCIQVNLSI